MLAAALEHVIMANILGTFEFTTSCFPTAVPLVGFEMEEMC